MLNRFWMLLFGLAVTTGCSTTTPAGVSPVTGFDVEEYVGTWYEIARLDHRFERGLSRVTAEYTLNDDGTIKVLNRGYDTEKGLWQTAEGRAKFRGDTSIGSLKVSFFGPFYGGYHIFELDNDYQYAMVAGPSKNYLWILARTPFLEEETYKKLVAKASELGFPTDKLIAVVHDESRAD